MSRTDASPGPGRSTRTLVLDVAEPFDLAAIFDFLAGRAIAGVEVVEAGVYRRTVDVDGWRGTLEVRGAPRGHGLEIAVPGGDDAVLARVAPRVRRWFDLDADVRSIGAHLSDDALLGPLVRARPGLRVPGAWDGFELAMRAVLGQQITVSAARALAGKLVATHGEDLPREMRAPGLSRTFPRAERLAAVDLATLGMPRARARFLSSLAAAAVADPLLFLPDGHADLETAVERLRALPGIGDWTAHYIALRALRFADAFPASDIGLLRGATPPGGVRPKPAALAAMAQAWRPWRGYAAQHLWVSDDPNRRRPESTSG